MPKLANVCLEHPINERVHVHSQQDRHYQNLQLKTI